jgi:hypothetical protein
MEGDGEERGAGFVERLGSGGFGDVGRDSGWDSDVTASFDVVSSGAGIPAKAFSNVDRLSTVGLSGPVMSPSVVIRCIIGAGNGSGTERALLARAADFGGTMGFGLDGPATAPPPNLSFIADTETGTSTSLLSIASSGSWPVGLGPADPEVNPFVSNVFGGLEDVGRAGWTDDSTGLRLDSFSSVFPIDVFRPSSASATEGVRGRDTGFPVLRVGVGLGPAFPAASDSKRDLSDAIDTGASSSSMGSLACLEPLGCPEEGGVGGAIFREAGSSQSIREQARSGPRERVVESLI